MYCFWNTCLYLHYLRWCHSFITQSQWLTEFCFLEVSCKVSRALSTTGAYLYEEVGILWSLAFSTNSNSFLYNSLLYKQHTFSWKTCDLRYFMFFKCSPIPIFLVSAVRIAQKCLKERKQIRLPMKPRRKSAQATLPPELLHIKWKAF